MSWSVAFTIWKSITAAIAIRRKGSKDAKVRKEQQDKINGAKKTPEVVMNGRE